MNIWINIYNYVMQIQLIPELLKLPLLFVTAVFFGVIEVTQEQKCSCLSC